MRRGRELRSKRGPDVLPHGGRERRSRQHLCEPRGPGNVTALPRGLGRRLTATRAAHSRRGRDSHHGLGVLRSPLQARRGLGGQRWR